MANRMVGYERQGLGQLRFGSSEGRCGIGYKQKCALDRLRARRSDERADIGGIDLQRAIEKAVRLRDIVRGPTLIEQRQTLKIEVHRVGVWSLFRASRLSRATLGVQVVRRAA